MTSTSEDTPEDQVDEIPSTAVSPDSSPTARLLEERSLEIINSVNTRTFETLFKYASSTFVDSRPLGPGQVANHTSADAVQFMRQLATDNPDYRVDATSTLVEINDEDKYATVWINIVRTGFPVGTKMENVQRFRWRQTKNGWECIKHSMLSASPAMGGL